MDSFELNKAAGAVLMVLLLTMGVGIVSDVIFTPTIPNQPGYEIVVESAESDASTVEAVPETVPLSERLVAATVEGGEKAAKKCAACHTFDKGGANKVGPNLWGIVDRKPASHEGFSYSAAMVAFGESNPEWTLEQLYAYLQNPKAHVPGTSMGFAGLKKSEERADMIVYMNSMSDSPVPLQ
ncbi:c-type cytochrome [Pannonibacter sp.]|uniref:c-type cytochrome n=1 Tax=Pannonibacter sp. TaxID=1906786 RepID=UPI003F6E90E1